MPKILTAMARARCPHGASAGLSSLIGTPDRLAGRAPMLMATNVGAVPFPCSAKPPCTAVISWNPAQSTVTVNGQLALTEASIPITNNGPGSIESSGQSIAELE